MGRVTTVEGARAGTRISREMGVSHAEFFRTLPGALGDRPYTVKRSEVLVVEGDRRITIRLATEEKRVLGALHLPMTRVEFVFSGYSDQDVQQFMGRFDRYFQRGGG